VQRVCTNAMAVWEGPCVSFFQFCNGHDEKRS
jgi:hypothetical protein